RRLRESAFGRVHAEGGTLWAYLRNGSARAHGVRNMTSEYWSDQAIAAVSREAVERSMIARRACFSCPVPCSALFAVDGATVEGVQANMYRAFATNVDVRDAGTLLRANRLVNELGLDCDHTSAVVAWAMELVDRGLLAQREIGFPLRWGAGGAMLGLIEAIGYRRGFGDLLAEGLDAASRSLGEETRPYANLVKGNAVMEAGFRSHPAWALGIVTSAKAAGHLRGAPAQEYQAEAGSLRPETSQDLFGFVFPGLEATPQQRAALVAWQERYKAVLDCMGLCTLSSAWMDAELYHPEEIAGLYSALTGIETSGETLMAYGERLNNLERAFNLLYAGFDRCHDYPPRRFMEEPLQEGRYAGARLERGEWEAMLDAYYREHHWDEPTGRPFPETLERHGLSRLAEQARDRLPA
ncbi:MAG: aldehyde ferredoxin oxidoreductase C-terminal domain-containing protein, partial [Synergistales bacterium]|nr:aldehyde ferredoxin oxidoreductase C-terminal domain-containing protein [Synergistales bacterium]